MAKDLVAKRHVMPHKYHLLLLQWWEARAASPFKRRVLFLVCMVMGTGSVERFFSFCKYSDTDQRYSMSDNACRVAFMAHYNGDVAGRLD